jgi:creatinine amidohydrolase
MLELPHHDRHLGGLAAHDVPRRVGPRSIAVLPFGAIEAHGPHLPLATDEILATALSTAAVAEHGDAHDLWQLPSLSMTKSNEHAWAPGTMWLSATTMLAVLDDLGRCLRHSGFGTVVFVNGHGGNSALLQVACRDLRLAHGLRTFLVHPWLATDGGDERGMSIHAGHDETSLVMHVRPDLVDLGRATRRVPEHLALQRHVRFGGSVSFGWTSDDFDAAPGPDGLPIGVIGDATRASAAHGADLFARIVTTMGEQFAEIRDFDPRIRAH